jgi:sugar lactone lactonase YvrE
VTPLHAITDPRSGRARLALILLFAVAAGNALAQRPSIPPQTIEGVALPYLVIDPADAVVLPPGFEWDQVASVAVDARNHLYVLHRGDTPFIEFDPDGRFVRSFGEGLFMRAHSLTLDGDDHFWVTDVGAHTVMQLDRDGGVLMTLGTPGEAGDWDETAGSRRFDQPTDVAIGPDGSVFVTQGHGRAEPKVLKFDAAGRYLRSWGERGTHPWQFAVAHSIAIDEDGLVYVADRENRRIQIYDLEGNFLRGWNYRGMACSLTLAADGYLYLVTGFDGQVVKLDRRGSIAGVQGRPGEGAGEYGEAHDIAVNGRGEIFVADVVNRRLQRLDPH